MMAWKAGKKLVKRSKATSMRQSYGKAVESSGTALPQTQST